ncbi:MAG: hypothetical protein ACQCN4_11500 [Candidatus Bathyarchaeia archaeon]|jgi:hypothetical protein
MPGKLPVTKLFSVDMGKGACCDCGQLAETQFVLTSGKGEAKRLAVEAKRARALHSTASDVCCGQCIAKRIAAKGLFVTEQLKYSPIKFERVTLDLKCLDCGKEVKFGDWAHFHSETGTAICTVCGVKRGWTDKTIAQNTVKLLELKADLTAVRKRVKVESQGLFLIEEKVVLHQIGEGYNELEKQIEGAIARLQSYFNAIATPQEKEVLQGLEAEIRRLQDLAREIKQEFDARLFWLDKNEQKVKVAQRAMSDEELEALQQAEGSGAGVPSQ